MGIVCATCSRQFEAGQYRDDACPACGAIAIREGPCPGCGATLASRCVDDVVIETCRRCGGLFADHRTIEQILGGSSERADAVLAALPAAQVSAEDRTAAICSSCAVVMEKRMVSGGAGIIVDVCRPHGLFFDPGELQRMIEFVRREARQQAERERGDRALHLSRQPRPPDDRYDNRWGTREPGGDWGEPGESGGGAGRVAASVALTVLRILVGA